MRKILFALLVAALLCVGCAPQVADEPTEPTTAPTTEEATAPTVTQPEASGVVTAEYAEAYIAQIRELETKYEDAELTYDLINFNGDDTPELVAGLTGYWVSMYTYVDGTLYTVADHWSYGAMGNSGYAYIPFENVLRNYNADYAGAILYTYFGRMNEACEIESRYDGILAVWNFKDTNGNGVPDADEPYGEEYAAYYCGERQLTEQEYQALLIEGEYKMLQGERLAQEMIDQLSALLSE